jgi:hypothetical protein
MFFAESTWYLWLKWTVCTCNEKYKVPKAYLWSLWLKRCWSLMQHCSQTKDVRIMIMRDIIYDVDGSIVLKCLEGVEYGYRIYSCIAPARVLPPPKFWRSFQKKKNSNVFKNNRFIIHVFFDCALCYLNILIGILCPLSLLIFSALNLCILFS